MVEQFTKSDIIPGKHVLGTTKGELYFAMDGFGFKIPYYSMDKMSCIIPVINYEDYNENLTQVKSWLNIIFVYELKNIDDLSFELNLRQHLSLIWDKFKNQRENYQSKLKEWENLNKELDAMARSFPTPPNLI